MPSSKHGSISAYQRGCRCDLCRAANTLFHNRYMTGQRTFHLLDTKATAHVRRYARWLTGFEEGRPQRGRRVRDPNCWTYAELAAHIGMESTYFGRFIRGESKRLSAKYADRIVGTPCRYAYLETQRNRARRAVSG